MDKNTFQDYYAILGLKFGASSDTIKNAFRALAKEHHPDKTGTADSTVFRAIRAAHDNLMDTNTRMAYDRTYWRKKFQTDPPVHRAGAGYTRTDKYEADMQPRTRPMSPPPKKPAQKSGEAGWKYLNGNAYKKWQRLMAGYHARYPDIKAAVYESQPPSPGPGALAHSLVVNMSHSCVLEACRSPYVAWQVQVGGPDHCVFCIQAHVGCRRCPGCEALACQACFNKIVTIERNPFSGLGGKTMYTASGG